jgi:hypothetical protein
VTATRAFLAGVVACTIAALLYLSLDSGLAAPPAERLVSLPLFGLAAIFGASAWAASVGGRPGRVPLFAGLSLGVAIYALVRLLAW